MKQEQPDSQDKQEYGFDEELVAYLDGELSRDNAARVEDALSENAEYRLRLKQLQQAWDLMDELPQSAMDESFTKSTVELVVVSAESEVMATVSRWKTWRIGVWAASLAAAQPRRRYYRWLSCPCGVSQNVITLSTSMMLVEHVRQ